jgi:hypothetical protein
MSELKRGHFERNIHDENAISYHSTVRYAQGGLLCCDLVGGSVQMFDPGGLKPGTDYYWRVDQVTPQGISKGEIWRFRARSSAIH